MVLPQLQGLGNGTRPPTPTSERALRAVLQVHTKTLDFEAFSRDLRASFLTSAGRILQWEHEATWARPSRTYWVGSEQDWSNWTMLSVEPMWVKVLDR